MKTKWLRILPVVILAGLLGFTFLQRQQIQDWWKLRGYIAPASIVQLADEDTMNAYTRHLFYLNKPQLLNTVTQFRQYCPENENTIVLGCYHPVENGIYIYAVQDASLAGIQQVTAAHEVLHAVYARLSNSDRTELDSELESYYLHDLTDPNVKAEVALYQKTEPNSVYDEMSCTFGTEIAQLPAALNQYYAQFFTNRQKIVGYEEQYQTQFTSREQQITTYDAQLAAMKQQISAQESSLTAQNTSLNIQQAQLQQELASGQVASYNTAVDNYNEQVNSYNAALVSLKQQIDNYNQLVSTRNAIGGQLTTLDSAIDTRLATATNQ
jgi:regulator of replication initiation timing